VDDDVFNWDQMFKNQELNLKIDEVCVLQPIVLGIEYAWLNDSNLLQLVSFWKLVVSMSMFHEGGFCTNVDFIF
jgi:hypothetical protein